MESSYKKIDYSKTQGTLGEFYKEINRGFKELETIDILQNFKAIAENQMNLLTACRLLCDEDLQERHFEELRKLLNNERHSGRMLFVGDGLLLSPVQLQERYNIR